MSKFNIVVKIILPLLIGLILISVISVFSLYLLLENNIKRQSFQSFKNVTSSLNQVIQQDTDLMVGLINQLQKDTQTIDLYKKRNKEWLFMYLHQTFSEYKARYDITHFYIHDLDRINFVRIHDFNKNGDMINRNTLRNAQNTLTVASGIEFGIYHNLTLRVVVPWFVEGELIGYIELGKEIDTLTEKLANSLNADIIFTAKKELITQKEYEHWKNHKEHSEFYKSMNNYYIIDSTVKHIDSDLQQLLNDKNTVNATDIENGDALYYLNATNYIDVNGNEIGKIFVLLDSAKEHTYVFDLIIKISLIISALIFLLIAYYSKYIKLTENKLNDAYTKIQKISTIDVMTNLYNKNFFLDNALKQIQRAARNKTYISFILLDNDNFKKYNDNYGHLKGDDVLKAIATCMQNNFKRATDCCYRVGGEEFLIITENTESSTALNRAKQLCEEIEKLNILHEYNFPYNFITVSIGVYTELATQHTNSEICFSHADKALYVSKEKGRNQVNDYHLIEKKESNV